MPCRSIPGPLGYPVDPLDAATVRSARTRLLRWYRAHRRALPWRKPDPANAGRPNPYHILVSEAMLQQTQVATVIAYFQRFMAALPTLADLAAANEQQVLRLWQGLGYYRRARHLHQAARLIVAEHGGMVPRRVEALLRLPGIGRYSAGAIASIAYNQPAAILDGNVARVLARWRAMDQPTDEPSVRQRLWRLAEQLVPRRSAGDFNQAMMELGALVCTPRLPRCEVCPLRGSCAAHQAGLVAQLPVKKAGRKPRPVTHHIVALSRHGRYLFEKRPESGLWAGLWQMPTCEQGEHDGGTTLSQWVRDSGGPAVGRLQRVESFTHQTTHRTIRFVLWRGTSRQEASRRLVSQWRSLDALDDLPLSNPQRRAVALLREGG